MSTDSNSNPKVPYFCPDIGPEEIEEVVNCLKSGWLTTGPKTKQFENEFADFVHAKNAIALNSCTAALHLAVVALGLQPKQAVLVPTMTFAATAEVVQYCNAIPILVDCEASTLNMDLNDAEAKILAVRSGETPLPADTKIAGIMPVHVGGYMMNMDEVNCFAKKFGLWVVEDAAHALPASFRNDSTNAWKRCGESTADVTCYSFYANKTITTGEGGMAVCSSNKIAEQIRTLSLHGLSHDAWRRFSGGSWDYQIELPGYKYNLTDIAAAIGIHQLKKAELLRSGREAVANFYFKAFSNNDFFDLPARSQDRLHSWHLFPIRLKTSEVEIHRNQIICQLNERAIHTSVHWRPLHLHPHYQQTVYWQIDSLPVASREWARLISLPIYPTIKSEQLNYITDVLPNICKLL